MVNDPEEYERTETENFERERQELADYRFAEMEVDHGGSLTW